VTVVEFLANLRERDIHIWIENDQLKVNAKAGSLTSELQEQLRDRKAEILDYFRTPADLSFAQQRLWFLDQMEMVDATYLIPFALHIAGPLSVDSLEKALTTLIMRHESLRTSFPSDGTRPLQQVAEHIDFRLPIVDIHAEPGQLDARMRTEMHAGFDLARGPLFRAVLYRLAADEHVLLTLQHHAISDAWSLGVLTRELGILYDDGVNGRECSLPKLQIQYQDYTRWLREWMQGDVQQKQLEYWRSQLAGASQVLEIPADRPRPSIESHRGANYSFPISSTVHNGIAKACRDEGTTMFMFLLAALDILLLRYTGHEDLLIGVPVANRNRKEFEDLIGMFVNTLVVRNDLSGDPTVKELLAKVREWCLGAYSHQELPVENLVEHLQPQRDLSRNPLFQIMLVFDNKAQQTGFITPGIKATPMLLDRGATHIDLTMYVEDSGSQLTGIIEYATDLFDESTIARMAAHWHRILEKMVDSPEKHISNLSLLSDAEREQLLVDWNRTERGFPRDTCLHQLIERRVQLAGGRTAVESGTSALSYTELDGRANKFARSLRERGVHRGCNVGICVDRSTDMLVAVLGILKAGAAYVPLDPSFPRARLQFMAEDAQLALLVSTEGPARDFELPRSRQLLLDSDAATINDQSMDPLPSDAALDATPEDPAYLIYTSGSTGKPKGVVVPHRAAVNFLNSMAREPGLCESDVLVAVTTLSFDISVLELYLPLTVGAKVVIATRDESLDGDTLKDLLEKQNCSVMQATPVTWRLLLDAGWTGGSEFKALVGGEALPRDLAETLVANNVELWNMYGPTETTVWSTCARITDTAADITIGKPIDNTSVYILDAQRNLCPVGIPGELYIGGDGVTHGYWQRPELTADRFIEHPYIGHAGQKIYGTGDKARWRADGTLEHLGRLDDQVKVRGYRVELGEIESRIAEHPDISEAAARLWTVGPDDVRIVACYVPEKSKRVNAASLRKILRARLPEYMLPQYFLPVDEIPLTPNAKVDRRRLPTPATAESTLGQQEPPENPVEKAIADIWTELIQPARPIGRNDMFFEMGGHSLLALRALRQIENTFGEALDFRLLFQENLAEIASRLNVPQAHQEVASTGAT